MKRAVLALPALVLVVIALWEIVATLRAPATVPPDAAWQRVMAEVRAQAKPGDLVVFAPAWIDPVGRLHARELVSVADASRMDSAKYARIWEVAIRGAHAPEVRGLSGGSPVGWHGPHGELTATLYTQTPVTVLADLRERLATARVAGGTARVDLVEVGFAPHTCIVATPSSDRAPMTITFPGLPLGAELVGYLGIADVFTRRDNRTPVQIDVLVGGVVATRATAGVDDGWVRFALATTPGQGDIGFALHAQAAARQICFAAEARQ